MDIADIRCPDDNGNSDLFPPQIKETTEPESQAFLTRLPFERFQQVPRGVREASNAVIIDQTRKRLKQQFSLLHTQLSLQQ